MTIDEIINTKLNAMVDAMYGRELDEQIALHVFGWRAAYGKLYSPADYKLFEQYSGLAKSDNFPAYSETESPAFAAAKIIREMGWHVELKSEALFFWQCTISRNHQYAVATASTVPLAICRAALKRAYFYGGNKNPSNEHVVAKPVLDDRLTQVEIRLKELEAKQKDLPEIVADKVLSAVDRSFKQALRRL